MNMFVTQCVHRMFGVSGVKATFPTKTSHNFLAEMDQIEKTIHIPSEFYKVKKNQTFHCIFAETYIPASNSVFYLPASSSLNYFVQPLLFQSGKTL